jgi:hypothetical protein
MKKPSVQREMLVKEGGSALLYLLFLIAFVGIVGAVMLTTVTQGQRNIVKSKDEQTQFYRSEGVIEIALKAMEEYENEVVYEPPVEPEEIENPENPEELAEPEIIVEAGVYFYIKNVLNSPKTYTYPIDGQDTVIIGERVEINEHTAKAKLYDPLHPDTYRIITASYDGDNEGPGPGPDPHPEYPSIEDPGFAYIDKNHNWKYDEKKDVKVPKSELEEGEVKTKDILVIPSSVGQITSTNKVEYSADKGLFLGAGLESKSSQDIELKTKNGKLIVADGVTIASSAKLEMKTENNSEILISRASLSTPSYGSIEIKSEGLLTIHQSTISSSSGIIAYSKKDLNITSSDFSSNGTIELKTDKALTMKQATLNSSGKITVNAKQDINGDHSSLSSNGDIQIESKENISVQEAKLHASRDINFSSSNKKHTVNITKASLIDRNDNLAEAGPKGVNILGTPITGCITNGEQKICSSP